jgi:FkbM family methyltransferase
MIITLDKMIKRYGFKINGVLHIGAHFGQEYEAYVKAGVKKMIFFEPVKATFDKLKEHLLKFTPVDDTLSGVEIWNYALGSENGQKEMYIETANQGQSSSLLEPKDHLKYSPTITFDTKELVEVKRLDDVTFNRKEYNMINIDVQGYELEVFKGAVKTLKSIDIIYTEVNFEELYKGCVQAKELDAFLKPFGFVRILTQYAHKSWGDALYLKYE